ncbi:hypothetical protein, partial [Avibacterium paragallinarum]|uniref:hypothetical protein n=1 Tax=Avibacterium paragallinarum TaxID=728 RepID=UPI00300ED053
SAVILLSIFMTNVRNKKGINKTVTIFPNFVDKICDFSHKFIKYALPPPKLLIIRYSYHWLFLFLEGEMKTNLKTWLAVLGLVSLVMPNVVIAKEEDRGGISLEEFKGG